ncbi:hypothetical protein LCGC14_0013080 [marine sediment metagenome]|uniref:Uncharacterized protein n=2 Tax=root TaxID=1 RepID=A0A0F9Z3U3_9ZZZZ
MPGKIFESQPIVVVICVLALSACSGGGSDDPRPLDNPAVYQHGESVFKTHSVEITLQAQERTEITAALDKDKVILYHWVTDGSPVYADFHGHEPDDDSYWLRYREDEAAISSSGSLVAPMSGQHGWYYRNDNDTPVVISLQLTGFFNEIIDTGILDTPEAQE